MTSRKINYQYNIDYSAIHSCDYRLLENDLVSYSAYLNMDEKAIHSVTLMNKDKGTRQAIIYADGVSTPSCLTTIQFLLEDKCLHVIANFRSQHSELGRPNDRLMINYIVTCFLKGLIHETNDISITANVADYHNYG